MDRRNRIPSTQRAFSLIELLVVLGIILLLAATTVGAVLTLMRANAVGNGVNAINAQAGLARSIALRDGVQTALVFRIEDPDINERTLVEVASLVETPSRTEFQRLTDIRSVDLPEGVRVTGQAMVGPARLWTAPSYPKSRNDPAIVLALRFNPDGSVNPDDTAYIYNFDPQGASGSNVVHVARTTRFFSVLDEREFQIEMSAAYDANDSNFFNDSIELFLEQGYLGDASTGSFIDADIAIVTFAPNTGLPSVQRNQETP
ncbi:prepilin-type N-terminal cleavage/methylation domain-containing protein [Mucisphaera sp.]|uniref:prepilin-type N-terminal cleavage/methylation domain-containing protein n=1 Tax=Mucisphaera sp. TaxID=2913024 RepID=UPI003D0E5515